MTAEAVVLDTDVASRLMRQTLPATSPTVSSASRPPSPSSPSASSTAAPCTPAGGQRRLAELARWLTRVVVVPADATVARRWGEITGTALRAGRPLLANDAWVAACCLAYGVALATLNERHFQGIEGLRLVGSG